MTNLTDYARDLANTVTGVSYTEYEGRKRFRGAPSSRPRLTREVLELTTRGVEAAFNAVRGGATVDRNPLDALDQFLLDRVVHVPGPPRARVETDDYDKPDFLYWVLFPTNEVKFGRSHHPRKNRLDRYQTCFSVRLKWAAIVECKNRAEGEKMEALMKKRWERMGFKLTGGGDELFTTDILPSYEKGILVNGHVVPLMQAAVA